MCETAPSRLSENFSKFRLFSTFGVQKYDTMPKSKLGKEPMEATGTPDKRKTQPLSHNLSDSDEESATTKSAKRDEGNTATNSTKDLAVDAKLFGLVEDYYYTQFTTDWDEPPITPAVRNLLVKFGVAVHKHLSEEIEEQIGSINCVADLRRMMKQGFDSVSARLAKLENAQSEGKAEVKPNPAEKSAQITYSNMLKKRSEVDPETVNPKQTEKIEDDSHARKYTVLELENKVDDESFITVRSKLTKQLLKKQARVEKIVKTSTGNVALQYDTVEQQQNVERILQDEPIAPLKIRSSKNRPVSIALRGITREMTKDEVKKSLALENREHTFFRNAPSWDLQLIEPSDRRSRYQLGKITTSLQSARLLMNKPKIYLDSMAVNAELWKPGHRRCNKCLKPGHVAARCTEVKCHVCGGNHTAVQCSRKDSGEAKCIVCLREKKSSNHRATIKECPILMTEQLEEYQRVYNCVYDK